MSSDTLTGRRVVILGLALAIIIIGGASFAFLVWYGKHHAGVPVPYRFKAISEQLEAGNYPEAMRLTTMRLSWGLDSGLHMFAGDTLFAASDLLADYGGQVDLALALCNRGAGLRVKYMPGSGHHCTGLQRAAARRDCERTCNGVCEQPNYYDLSRWECH